MKKLLTLLFVIIGVMGISVGCIQEPVFHTLTISAENGEVILSQENAVSGTEIAVTATPNEGYQIARMYYMTDESEEVSIEDNKFNMPDKDVVVYVVFEEIKYNISTSIINGSVTLSQENATAGTEIIVTATPDEGYRIVRIYYTQEASTEEVVIEDNTFAMPDSDVIIYVDIEELQTYTITLNYGFDNVSCPTEAREGETVELYFYPVVSSWQWYNFVIQGEVIDFQIEESIFHGGYYTFIMPSDNVIITVSFVDYEK